MKYLSGPFSRFIKELLLGKLVRMDGVMAGGIQRVNEGHVFPVQGKVKDVQIGPDSVRVHGFGKGHDAALQFPAEAYLGHGFFMLVRNPAQNGFLQYAAAGQGAP